MALAGLFTLFGNSYLAIAIFGTTIFVIQLLLSLIGLGGENHDGLIGDHGELSDNAELDSLDVSQASDALHVNFFSLKGIVAFLTFYGWVGYLTRNLGWGSFFIAIVCGLIMMALVSLLIALVLRMQQSGNITAKDLIGRQGTVYLAIPGGNQGVGKVTVALPRCTRQIKATCDQPLPTGVAVEVVKQLASGVFQVKAL